MKKIKKVAILSVLIGVLLASNVLVFRQMSASAHVGYCADEIITTRASSETINYTNREEEYIGTVNSVPLFSATSELSNSCGAIAGSIVVGFYDKYYEDLIDGYTSYYPATGRYKLEDKVYIPALKKELYTLMRTNVDDVGVSESDCLAGLKSYVQSKGHSISYNSIKSSSKLNEVYYKNAINANQPVLIFSKQAEVYLYGVTETKDVFSSSTVNGNHVYVGFGYVQIKYYNGTNNFRTDTYLRVACGLSLLVEGYLRVSSTADSTAGNWFDSGYAVIIA